MEVHWKARRGFNEIKKFKKKEQKWDGGGGEI